MIIMYNMHMVVNLSRGTIHDKDTAHACSICSGIIILIFAAGHAWCGYYDEQVVAKDKL